ncbi:MAG: hypothetical protein NC337_11940, partial [Roseburia sp.]|nr:hypothetical protein [Roseburia sp.]
ADEKNFSSPLRDKSLRNGIKMKEKIVTAGIFIIAVICLIVLILEDPKKKVTMNREQLRRTEAEASEQIEQTAEAAATDIGNPYFYDKDTLSLKAKACYWEESEFVEREQDIRLYKVKAYENGSVYRLSVDADVHLGAERTNIYFYVTRDQIYRLSASVIQGSRVVSFVNDDDMLVKLFDTEEKLMENGQIVCQEEELADGEEGYGAHTTITRDGNRILYRYYFTKVNGEADFCESFTWENGKGLTEYKSWYRAEADPLYLYEITEASETSVTEKQ